MILLQAALQGETSLTGNIHLKFKIQSSSALLRLTVRVSQSWVLSPHFVRFPSKHSENQLFCLTCLCWAILYGKLSLTALSAAVPSQYSSKQLMWRTKTWKKHVKWPLCFYHISCSAYKMYTATYLHVKSTKGWAVAINECGELKIDCLKTYLTCKLLVTLFHPK